MHNKTLVITCGYMDAAHGDIDVIASDLLAEVGGVKFDTIVGTGLSGSLVIPELARILNKNWLIVRKENDGSHSIKRAEGVLGSRWLFVDDFVSSGRTYRYAKKVVRKICKNHNHTCTHAGVYQYETHLFKRLIK